MSKISHFNLTSSRLILAFLAFVWTAPVIAQHAPLYRIVREDGRVVFSDRPFISNSADKVKVQVVRSQREQRSLSALPQLLRVAVEGNPVLLYTGEPCEYCPAAREHLKNRGVPFQEKTVSSQADRDAFKNIAGSPIMPTLQIGTKVLRGYQSESWKQYLDAAQYPEKNLLPPSYKAPAAAPLVAAKNLPPPIDPNSPNAKNKADTPPLTPLPESNPTTPEENTRPSSAAAPSAPPLSNSTEY